MACPQVCAEYRLDTVSSDSPSGRQGGMNLTDQVLVTGAAGFVGARTAQVLLDSGRSVVGIDNLNDYYDVRLKRHRLDALLRHPRFSFERIDIEDIEVLKRVCRDAHVCEVVHLAARAGVQYSTINPHIYVSTNVLGTLNVLEVMRHQGIKKMVLASTSSLYAGQTPPFVEDLPVNTPLSPYAATKKAAEALAHSYHHLYGVDVTVLRYFTVFGPAGRPDMSIFRFIKWIDEGKPIELFGDGTQSRDFTFIDDIAVGTSSALRPIGYEVINLGGGRAPVSINKIIESVGQMLGRQPTIVPRPAQKADMQMTQADIRKAKHLLQWESKIDVFTGLERTVRWYVENREWLRDISI